MKENRLEYLVIIFIVTFSIGVVIINEHLLLHATRSDIWIFIGLFAAIVGVCLMHNLLKKGSDPYEIINPILIGYSLYSLMLPLNYLITLHVPTVDIRVPGIAMLPMYQYLMICTIGLIGLLLGYYLPLGKRYSSILPVWTVSNRELKIAAIVLMAYGLFSFATNIAAYGGLANYIAVGYGPQRYVIQREALHFGSGMEIIGIASIILMYVSFVEKKKIRFALLVSVIIIIAYISLLIGQRRYIVYLLFMAFVVVNYRFIRIKLRWMLITLLLAYAFLFVYPHTRKLWSQVGFTEGVVATYNIAVENPELLLPFASGEFIPPSKVILEVLTDDSFQFHYGASYISGLIRVIPRIGSVMPEVLQRLSDWRMKTYYPGLYERGVNFIFFIVGEGYVNFGYWGAFLHMFIYGLIARMLYSYFRKNQMNSLSLLVYAAVFALIPIESLHAEFTQFIWYMTHIYLGPLLLILGAVKFVDYVCKNRE
jgi:oligosaccharide repeat unit polymerase